MVRKSIARMIIVSAVAAAATLGAAGMAQAGEGPLYQRSEAAKMSRKFVRGLGNVVFFWAEAPKSIFTQSYSVDPFTGFFSGLTDGVKNGAKRLGVGVWETVTFFAPLGRDYRPYIEPEFVLMDYGELPKY